MKKYVLIAGAIALIIVAVLFVVHPVTAQTTTNPMQVANAQFLICSSGTCLPNSGGSLSSFIATTNTPLETCATTVISTGACSVSNGPVVTLNTQGYNAAGSGSTGIWPLPGRCYKFVLKDAGANILWTIDNVCTSSTLQSASGATTTVQYNNGGILAGSTNFTWANGTQILTIAGATTGGVTAHTFSSSNTGTDVAFTTTGATFTITGAGDFAGQSFTAANALTADHVVGTNNGNSFYPIDGLATGATQGAIRGRADGNGYAFVGLTGRVNSMTLSDFGGTCTVGTGVAGISCVSDERKKTDIAALGSELANVMKLRPSRFRLKTDKAGTMKAGFIAQQAMTVYPDSVSMGDDGYYSMNYSALVPRLVKAIQEQQAEIDELKKKVK